MGIWIKLTAIALPYKDPKTGQTLESIAGRKNSPRINEFKGGGREYPPSIPTLNILCWMEKRPLMMILFDEPEAKLSQILQQSKYNPVQLTFEEALQALKDDIGLHEDTYLDEDGRPITPTGPG